MSDNAQLISAASIMFDVLLSVREFMDPRWGGEAVRLIEEIDEAIALVRGTKP